MNNETPKHTPTPWHVYRMGNYFGINSGSESGTEKNDRTIVTYGDGDDDLCGVRGDTVEEMYANAELIVRAVNTHDQLVEALEAVVRHGLIEKDGYVMVLNEIHNALKKAKS